jgi:mannose-1-phosphate guanylyltransferase
MSHRRLVGQAIGNTWGVVLAAGEGKRLRRLTTSTTGVSIPKQFCSLQTGPSLIAAALRRGSVVARRNHLCTVVALEHRRWWGASLAQLPGVNVIVQPENRGTANGILLPLLHILERDPDANIVLLPSDHHVEDEATLAGSLRQAVAQLDRHPSDVLVLGIQPTGADTGLGYIVPGRDRDECAMDPSEKMVCFVEKPSAAYADELIRHGGLWNSFILAVKARALLALFDARVPHIVMEMREAIRYDIEHPASALAIYRLYALLPMLDFSRDIVEGQEARLRVLQVPDCGWSDLGTPERVERALREVTRPQASRGVADRDFNHAGFLSLASQCFSSNGRTT